MLKYSLLAAIALAALATPSWAQQNGAQYGDPNNPMAEGSQNNNGAVSGQTPDASDRSKTRSYFNSGDLDQNSSGAFSLQSNGSLNNGASLSANPASTP